MIVSVGSLQRSSRSAMKCNLISLSFLYWSPCWILLLCFFRLKKFVLTEPQSEAESVTTRISAGSLRVYEKSRGMSPSVYDCVDVSGPPHNRIFTMTCKQGDHVTRGKLKLTSDKLYIYIHSELNYCFPIGTAKSKQFAKNIAASHMLKILSDSSQDLVNPQEQQQQQWFVDVVKEMWERMHFSRQNFSSLFFFILAPKLFDCLIPTVNLNELIFVIVVPLFAFFELISLRP